MLSSSFLSESLSIVAWGRHPEAPSSEMAQLVQKDRSDLRRFSVAGWPDKNSPDPAFWVIVKLRGSAGSEFFNNYFTDAIEYRSRWKKDVAPACKNIH
jgi:hypothetical protein